MFFLYSQLVSVLLLGFIVTFILLLRFRYFASHHNPVTRSRRFAVIFGSPKMYYITITLLPPFYF